MKAWTKWAAQVRPGYAEYAAVGPDGTIYLAGVKEPIKAYSPDGRLKWYYRDSEFSWGAPAISADAKTVYYMYKDPKNIGSQITDDWNIWYAKKKGGKWGSGKPIEIINSPFFEGYPSITADGKYLYFIHNSNRFLKPDGKLDQDLGILVVERGHCVIGNEQRTQELVAPFDGHTDYRHV